MILRSNATGYDISDLRYYHYQQLLYENQANTSQTATKLNTRMACLLEDILYNTSMTHPTISV
jgi:ActR/RegA family two-component response regulator